MKETGQRIVRLFVGLFLYSTGIAMTINANVGLAPWDVLHQGLSKTIGITIGQASIGMGIILVVINSVMKEKLGGDPFEYDIHRPVPGPAAAQQLNTLENIVARFAMMVGGMFV